MSSAKPPTNDSSRAAASDTPETIIETSLTGHALLSNPFFNKSSAFSDQERDEFGLHGLLPHHVSSIEEQLQRTYANFHAKDSPIEQYIFLSALHDRNETLFYRLVQTHITEMVPVIYTPTVGEACQRYSHIFRRARGIYLAYSDPHRIPTILDQAPSDIDVIVVTDGERILGLGDLGVGGMGIPIGKLALYTLCAGIHPLRTLPVFLDVGTNNEDLLKDPLYLGWRHPRLESNEYARFIDLFVEAVAHRWPRAILQWEDFSKTNAWPLLQRYQKRLPSFNDDIQGTAAVTVAGLLRAVRAAGRSLKNERVVIVGAGSAATGITTLLREAMRREGAASDDAQKAVWLIDTKGLVHEGRPDLSEEKQVCAQRMENVRAAGLLATASISLADVVQHLKPTALLGVSGQSGMFDEALVRTMAATIERPIIFPLSNPTSKSEAIPEQLIEWTEGRALIATGSPFPAVFWRGRTFPIGQCNNAFIFPGVGLGLIVSGAHRVPEEVFLDAAETLASFNDRLPGYESSLFPNLEHVRQVSEQIAIAVAKKVVALGLSTIRLEPQEIPQRVRQSMWTPVYAHLRHKIR